jgi:hypothetical protein
MAILRKITKSSEQSAAPAEIRIENFTNASQKRYGLSQRGQ